jgi:uncharacterized protein (DUF433 family)
MTRSNIMSQDYVRTDEYGVMRVGNTRISLDSVVAGIKRGDSPESIREQYPTLSLEDVKRAIAYYHGHCAEVEAYLARQDQVWEYWRGVSERNPSPVVERLRKLKQARSARGSV